jgi:hypothetical protein
MADSTFVSVKVTFFRARKVFLIRGYLSETALEESFTYKGVSFAKAYIAE